MNSQRKIKRKVVTKNDLIKSVVLSVNGNIAEKIMERLNKSKVLSQLSNSDKMKLFSELINIGLYTSITNSIYNSFEEKIKESLAKADFENNVTVRLLEGISLDSEITHSKEKVNNLTGETVVVPDKIKLKANISRTYIDKVTEKSFLN